MRIISVTKIYLSKSFLLTIRFHEINCLKKYGTLYDMLNNLVTNKISINNANIDQIHLISTLMQGYDKNDLFAEGIESKSWKNEFLEKAQTNF